MAYRCGDRYQMDLMPPSLEDYVSSDNPFVSEFVSQKVDCITLHGMVNKSETTEEA